MEKKNESDGFVGIAAVIGGLIFVTAMVFVIFAREQLGWLSSIAWALVVLGIILGFFKYKSMKK